jgi:hypothetical protein
VSVIKRAILNLSAQQVLLALPGDKELSKNVLASVFLSIVGVEKDHDPAMLDNLNVEQADDLIQRICDHLSEACELTLQEVDEMDPEPSEQLICERGDLLRVPGGRLIHRSR